MKPRRAHAPPTHAPPWPIITQVFDQPAINLTNKPTIWPTSFLPPPAAAPPPPRPAKRRHFGAGPAGGHRTARLPPSISINHIQYYIYESGTYIAFIHIQLYARPTVLYNLMTPERKGRERGSAVNCDLIQYNMNYILYYIILQSTWWRWSGRGGSGAPPYNIIIHYIIL